METSGIVKGAQRDFSKVHRMKLQVQQNVNKARNLKRMTQEQFETLAIPAPLKKDERVRALFERFGGLFSFDGTFGHTTLMEYEIKLKPGFVPVKQKQRKLSDAHKEFVAEQVRDLKEKGIIFEIDSDCVSPLVIVPKKNNKLRMCVDFRRLNEGTIKIRYHSPFIYEDIVNCLGEEVAEFFAILDLIAGYW